MNEEQPRSVVTIEIVANGYILTLPETKIDAGQKAMDAFAPVIATYLNKIGEHEGDPELERIRRENEVNRADDIVAEAVLCKAHNTAWDLQPAGYTYIFASSSELLDFLDNHVFTEITTKAYGEENGK